MNKLLCNKSIIAAVSTVAAALLMSFNVAASTANSQDNLGGGFVKGMSPNQTCLYFKKYYRASNEHNTLCKLVNRDKGFSNLTVVNRGITNAVSRVQHIENIAFFFNEDEELNLVMSVEDASDDSGEKRQFKHMNEVAQRHHYF